MDLLTGLVNWAWKTMTVRFTPAPGRVRGWASAPRQMYKLRGKSSLWASIQENDIADADRR
jgi:hypothetical protein